MLVLLLLLHHLPVCCFHSYLALQFISSHGAQDVGGREALQRRQLKSEGACSKEQLTCDAHPAAGNANVPLSTIVVLYSVTGSCKVPHALR